LALEHVGERLERTLPATTNGLGTTTVVEQRVDRFLKHPLLVAENDLRRAMLDELLETIVAVDHAAIQIIEIRGRKAPTVKRNQRTKIRGNDRHDVHDHPRRIIRRLAVVPGREEGIDDLEA